MVSETIIEDIIVPARTDMAAFTLSVQIVSKLCLFTIKRLEIFILFEMFIL